MSKVKMAINIAFFGDIDYSRNAWRNWFDFSKAEISKIGLVANYFEAMSEKVFRGKKILELSQRNETRLNTAFKENDKIEIINVYSLPEHFKSVFDYEACFMRGYFEKKKTSYVIVSVVKELFEKQYSEDYLKFLDKFISVKSGKVFLMDIYEHPDMYIWGLKSKFNTLKILKEF